MTSMATSRTTATASGAFWASTWPRRGFARVVGRLGLRAPSVSSMGFLAEGGADDVLGGNARPVELLGDRALAQHQHPVGEVADLLGVRGVEEDRAAVGGELDD